MSDQKYMKMAIQKAKEGMKHGQPPIGVCIVKDEEVISCVHNNVLKNMDATAHAEIEAIREACQKLDTIDLSGCILYSTSEPCTMCFTACYWANIGTIVYGARTEDAEGLGFEELNISSKQTQHCLGSNIELIGDVLRQEILATLKPTSFSLKSKTLAKHREQLSSTVKVPTTSLKFSSALCLHEIFAQQVVKNPEAIALTFEAKQITYQELNIRANQVAHYLLDLGIKPEVRVGLCLNRSLETIIGILAILKAGGAYVPLAADYPPERLNQILKDTQAPVLITESHLKSIFAEQKTQVVCLDMDHEIIAQKPEYNPKIEVSPSNLAYVIYTSGSTGKPKGVMVTHRNVARLFPSVQTHVSFNEHDTWTLFHSYSFGFSVWEIFGALLHGGRLIIVPYEVTVSTKEFYQLLCREKVTILSQTPSAFRLLSQIQENFDLVKPEHLRLIVFSGEALEPYLLKSWFNRNGDQQPQLINMYALTETSGEVAYHRLTVDNLDNENQNIIGLPLPDVEIYLFDEAMEKVENGLEGEIYIGGDSVARGYLNRPELNAQRFIPNPLKDTEKLYKTGDKARYLPSGELEFLGRADQQVKIRGYRVELGEIEAKLREFPEVEDAIVTAIQSHSDYQQLVAYLVPKTQKSIEFSKTLDQSMSSTHHQFDIWPSLGEYNLYDDYLYNIMTQGIEEDVNFKKIIKNCVKNKIVMDVGTGSEAICTRLCVEAGAHRVYGVELLASAFKKAEKTIDNLNIADKVVLFQGDVQKVNMPEKVDVIISRIFGNIGSSDGIVSILNNARRFLDQNGIIIPQKCVTKIVAVTLPEDVRNNPSISDISRYYFEKLFDQEGEPFDVRLCVHNFSKSNYISNTEIFETLDFSAYVEPEYQQSSIFTINQESVLDGFLLWLNVSFQENEVDYFDNKSGLLPVFFPVFSPGLKVSPGDRLDTQWSCKVSDNGLHPDYLIEGKLIKQDGQIEPFYFESFHKPQTFQQNPFYKSLFGDILLKDNRDLPITRIKEHLQSSLPNYMLPGHYIKLDALPLNANGKIDYQALPNPDLATRELETNVIGPRTLNEENLVNIWSEILEVTSIGVEDNFFFDLGGHSLFAMQVISRIREVFSIELSMRTLFEYPTVAKMAEEIVLIQAQSTDDDEVSRMLNELENLSSEDVEKMLNDGSTLTDE